MVGFSTGVYSFLEPASAKLLFWSRICHGTTYRYEYSSEYASHFQRKKISLWDLMLSVWSPFLLFKQQKNYHIIWYKYYVICSLPSIIHCNVLQFVATNGDVLTYKVWLWFIVPNFTYFAVVHSYILQNLKDTLKQLFHWICLLWPWKVLERQQHLN